MQELSLSEMKPRLVRNIQRGLVSLVLSAPGLGKSSLVHQVAAEYGLKVIDVRASQMLPEDFNGFPKITGNAGQEMATYVPFDTFPLDTTPVPEGYQGWLLFLDEVTTASKPVQAALYKIVLDRMVALRKLHPHCAIVMAGNRVEDRAAAVSLSTALKSRAISYTLKASANDWLRDYAAPHNIDMRVQGYIAFNKEKALHSFDPKKPDQAFASPRTWEFVSRIVSGEKDLSKWLPDISGAVGEGEATSFITFSKEYLNLPKYSDIVANPDTATVPTQMATRYAAITMLCNVTEQQDINKVLIYVKKYPVEFHVLFGRSISAKHPAMVAQSKDFANFAIGLGKAMM